MRYLPQKLFKNVRIKLKMPLIKQLLLKKKYYFLFLKDYFSFKTWKQNLLAQKFFTRKFSQNLPDHFFFI